MLARPAVALTVLAAASTSLAARCVVQPVGGEEGASEPTLRLYDVRDLAVAMAQPPSEEGDGDDGEPLDLMLDRIASPLVHDYYKLADGLFTITADHAAHETLIRLLNDVRDLYREPYEIELVHYAVAAADSPLIGSGAVPVDDGSLTRLRQVAIHRVAAALRSTASHAYVADWQPVVADSAVGYDPEVHLVEDGLQLEATVGSDHAADHANRDDRIHLSLSGTIAQAFIELIPVPVATASAVGETASGPAEAGQPLALGLPNVMTRDVRADLDLPLNRLTVVSVVEGFEPGQSIVIAAAVRRLDE